MYFELGNFAPRGDTYWSSSENYDPYSWYKEFIDDGIQSCTFYRKDSSLCVRPVRAF
jgi:hypothetical protein